MDQSDFLFECLVDATFCFLGAFLFYRSSPWAHWLNAWSVSLYKRFPRLKKLPGSRYAGTELNYKLTFIWFRILGAFMFLSGLFFLAQIIRIFLR